MRIKKVLPKTEIQKHRIHLASNDYDKLSSSGMLGFYSRCEVTTIFAVDKIENKIINLYTLCFFEENFHSNEDKQLITPKLLTLNKKYSIGIIKHYESMDSIRNRFIILQNNNQWIYNEKNLFLDILVSLPKQFVPAHNSPLSSVLKNNLFNGSYVLEFFDVEKHNCDFLYSNSNLLEKFQTIIADYLPIDILYIRERIGNIIFQFPITLVNIDLTAINTWSEVQLLSALHPSLFNRRQLVAGNFSTLDNNIIGCGWIQMDSICANEQIVPSGNVDNENTFFIVDIENQLILHYTKAHFIRSFNQHVSIGTPHAKPRIFSIPSAADYEEHRIDLVSQETRSSSEYKPKIYDELINRRLYEQEREEQIKNKTFIQYGSDRNSSDRVRALLDLRELIKKHGSCGVYLWDPYLTFSDLFSTLYFLNIRSIPLRALGSFNHRTKKLLFNRGEHQFTEILNQYIFPRYWAISKKIPKKIHHHLKLGKLDELINNFTASEEDIYSLWKAEQQEGFTKLSNNVGLNIEFRCQHSTYGWQFHDRFIIFPKEGRRPKVWSLGTSVNSLGKHHHILQEITNAQNILDAFLELWNALEHETCIVWRYNA